MNSLKLKDNYIYFGKGMGTHRIPYSENGLVMLEEAGYDSSALLTLAGKLRYPLYRYQVTAICRAFVKNWNLLLADTMGVGKTLSAIACMVASGSKKTLIVVPANVKYQWKREIERAVKIKPYIFVCEGRTYETQDYLFLKHSNVCLINYQILDDWLELLLQFEWDMMILDEAHKIKKTKSHCTKACKFIRRQTKAVIALSGTPLTDRTADIWNVIHIVDPAIFPSELAFQQSYCSGYIDERGRASISANTLDLHMRLETSGIMLRRRKEDVYKELPKVSVEVVPLNVTTEKLQELEKEVCTRSGRLIGLHGKDRGMFSFQLQQSMEAYLQASITAKLPMILKWIEDFLEENTDEKLIAAVSHRAVAGNVMKRHFGNRALLLDGSVDSKKKDAIVSEFMGNPECRLLIGNIQSISFGIDGLQKVCSHLAVCELPWSVADLMQLIARLDRNGQKQPVDVSMLMVYNSVDEMLARTLDKKRNVLAEVLDGETCGESESILHMLSTMKEQDYKRGVI